MSFGTSRRVEEAALNEDPKGFLCCFPLVRQAVFTHEAYEAGEQDKPLGSLCKGQ
jgi:hypothetical protein